MQQFSSNDIFDELERIANKFDKASRVVILTREPVGNAQIVKKVTYGIMVEPNNEKLVTALIKYGMSTNNEVEFHGSFVNLQTEALVDVLQVTANIHYKE